MGAALLDGTQTVVVRGLEPREPDGIPFKYVGVVGVGQPRTFRVRLSATQMK